jgi:hypothetical protein
MKIFTFLAAFCLMGMASCSQKVCPAYSKTDSVQHHPFAKEVTPANPGTTRS